MSNAYSASNAMSAAILSAAYEVARSLVALAAQAVASAVLRQAARRAHRELANLDDRMLADIGLDRTAVEDMAAISRRRSARLQFPSRRLRVGE